MCVCYKKKDICNKDRKTMELITLGYDTFALKQIFVLSQFFLTGKDFIKNNL